MCFPFFFLDLVNVYFCVVFRITFAKVQPCASDVKYFPVFFLFSQYYSLTLHSQRFATLPLETPCREAVRLKGNGVRVPDCPAAVSRPYLRARTREPLKPCISVLSAWVWQGCHTLLCFGKVFASGRRVRRPAETHLPMESSPCASRIGRV